MKTWMMSVVCAGMMMTSAAHADAAKVIAKISGRVSFKIQTVELLSDGTLVATIAADQSKASSKISSENFNQLKWIADSLSTAQLTTDHRAAVCETFIAPLSTPSLQVADANGKLQTVLSPSGCWAPTFTHPAEEYLTNQAQELEQTLIVLANEAAKI